MSSQPTVESEYTTEPVLTGDTETPSHSAPHQTTLAHTNTFAVVSLILAFIQPIAGIVFGHMGMSQIKKNGDAGRGIALTGLIVGYVYTALLITFFIAYIGFFIFLGIAMSFDANPDMMMGGYDR